MEKVINTMQEGGGVRPKSSIQPSKSTFKSQKHHKKVQFKDASTTSVNSQGDAKQAMLAVQQIADCAAISDSVADIIDEVETFESDKFTGNIYSKPEIHSTLLLAEKLQSIHMETFNPEEAVRKKLEQCDKTRKRIVHKSVKHLNIPKSVTIFKDMIPLEFNEQSFLRVAAEERAEKWKHIMPKSAPKDPEPSVEEFLTPEKQPEYFTMPAPQFHFPHLQAVSLPSTTNRLYMHRRKWENLL
ncbi:hypothetical protein CHUAL_007138 [Chamberlinius hualienensis]